MKKIVTLVAVICFASLSVSMAQQDPIYAQYLNNPYTLNPAYAGSNNMLNSQLQYRLQWAGLAGNPVTANFNVHSSIFQNKMGLGLQVIQDQIGENKNTEVNVAYAYKVELTDATLSFGLQAGFINYTNNINELTIQNPSDPLFFNYSEMQFNTGAGIMLLSDRYVVGLSAPRLLPATVSQGGETIEVYNQNYYFFGSYKFFLSEKVSFRPATLLKYSGANPLSVDLNANFSYLNTWNAGLFTRNLNTYGLLVSMTVNNFRFGYVLELPTNNSVGVNYTSHEFMIGLKLKAFSFHDPLLVRSY
ncbi:MAG: type IX secretion system membrane protein PorP/SprF [Cyclobacteriaceae bacterium]|jgi:type IX secretion system PorP/SprF family membrane protein|nr:type IX secretion system membrane protein PorP/SprF [Cyclobacteriaceae bacterium]